MITNQSQSKECTRSQNQKGLLLQHIFRANNLAARMRDFFQQSVQRRRSPCFEISIQRIKFDPKDQFKGYRMTWETATDRIKKKKTTKTSNREKKWALSRCEQAREIISQEVSGHHLRLPTKMKLEVSSNSFGGRWRDDRGRKWGSDLKWYIEERRCPCNFVLYLCCVEISFLFFLLGPRYPFIFRLAARVNVSFEERK